MTKSLLQELHEAYSKPLNNYQSKSIFFARSKFCPQTWHYDHVGFIINGGKQLQMSGHMDNEVYITNHINDDPNFAEQKLTILKLNKTITVPSSNTVHAENCSTFVGNVLFNNGLPYNSSYLNTIFKNGLNY